MSAAVTLAAVPVTALTLWALLRLPVRKRLVAVPTGERWHERPTPTFGGVGIFAGFVAAIGAALAVGAVEASSELLGVIAGCSVVFVAGLVDDVIGLPPLAKLVAQLAAAGVAIAAGLSVEIVEGEVLPVVIGVLWLVGITNAFNLLDNMDGLASTLAAIACGYFALDAVTPHDNELVLALALSLGLACTGFLPFNLRPGRGAALFMGDSGSQLLGFGLAAIGMASSWTTTGVTVATMLLPLLVLAVPILDTALVTVVRLVERRPVTQGGKDHTSHRLVYYGLSETRAVGLLAALALALGATAIAYSIFVNKWVTILGVLVTVVLLVEFASFLSDLEQRARAGAEGDAVVVRPVLEPRRIAEIVFDFGLMCAAFLAAYVFAVDGLGGSLERAGFLAALPVVLVFRYVAFVLGSVYRRVWRFAGPRDALVIATACTVSAAGAFAFVTAAGTLARMPAEVFAIDAVLSTMLVGGSRLAVRLVLEARDELGATERRRTLVVGAGRSGRSLARELRETPGERVVGFLDDNPRVRRRRIVGVPVVGGLGDALRAISDLHPDNVYITIPDAPAARLESVVRAAEGHGVPCRVLRREAQETTTDSLVEVGTK